MKINLNDRCTVVLTQSGADWINKINTASNQQEFVKAIDYRFNQDYAAGDEYKDQLWHIMEMFSPMLGLGCEVPFENCLMEVISS